MATILVGAGNGVTTYDTSGTRRTRHLEGHDVRALAPDSWSNIWAVVDRQDIWRAADGEEWRRVASLADASRTDLIAHCIADTRANADGGILIGTSRARLFRVSPDFRVEAVAGFDDAPRAEWHTPWGAPADTRSITEDDGSVLVNVHVGGVLRSRDEGTTWQPTIDLHADVHRVVTGAGRIYAAGAFGLSVSDDGGDTWRLFTDGLHAAYCRSVVVCGPFVLLSSSTGPNGRHAALYRTNVAAGRFERCRAGLPEWFDDNIDSPCLDALPSGDLAAFGTESGELYVSTDQGASWARIADSLGAVRSVVVLP